MPLSDKFILMGVGGIFVILGIILILWGRGEEKGYYSSLAGRPDAREFLEHWPQRPRRRWVAPCGFGVSNTPDIGSGGGIHLHYADSVPKKAAS
jgi:hypothetical protein